ncbi:MAG: DUF349 domain-containing protein [Flavobacteriaceae bacterium]
MPEEKDQEIQESKMKKDKRVQRDLVSGLEEHLHDDNLDEMESTKVKAPKKKVAKKESRKIDSGKDEPENAAIEEKVLQEEQTSISADGAKVKAQDEETHVAVQSEIDDENAEDAEDHENKNRHHIPLLDYHSMPMENLVGELQRLVRNEKVQAIKQHVEGIKYEFDLKFQDFIEGKKEEFVNAGGNEVDFKYNSNTKRQFNEVYADYREKRDHYYKNLEKSLKENLASRLSIIDELKGLVNMEEDINTTYNSFKSLQERWRQAGPIPRANYNDVWRTYQHHIEIFYDFLSLNRELRDLDFKHNLEEKTKLVESAEALADEKDLGKAFRNLQELHKIWKEEIGPVDREHRDAIWERFSNATKALHLRRQEQLKELEQVYEANLTKKIEIISQIDALADEVAHNHRALQQQIKLVNNLRDSFFKAGKVPQRANEENWGAFKSATRKFNHKKNTFYKNLKKEQQHNLDQKRALLALANELKDSEDWEMATPEMKRIQNEWKKIGHVPRKFSDRLWEEFKNACNHYFDRLHSLKNGAHKQEAENLEKKNAGLERLRQFSLSGDREKDIAQLKGFIAEWKSYGRVPYKDKNIDQKFNKILDAIFKKLNIGRKEAELMKYGNKIQQLAKADDHGRALGNERQFIRKKLDETKAEIRQLENNLQFFSNGSEDNPIVQEVIKKIDRYREDLETWKGKLKKLNIAENSLNRAADEASEADVEGSEEG